MIRHIALLLTLCVVTQCCPRIISKSQWKAKSPRCIANVMKTPVPYVVIHHTTGGGCTNQASCSEKVRNIQNYHINSQKWCDVGYSFLVGEDGNVYEGRGWNRVGVSAPSYGSRSIGISVIGDFTSRNPNSAAQNAVRSLIACGISKGFIQKNYRLRAHRDVTSTSCPGNAFYNLIKKWPNYKK